MGEVLPCRMECHAERSRSISSLAMRYVRRLLSASRRFFVTLRMTPNVSLLIFSLSGDKEHQQYHRERKRLRHGHRKPYASYTKQ